MALRAIDSSVAIAAFAPWHEHHERAFAALDGDPGIPVHALLETYSVLTRLPAPMRAPHDIVRTHLAREFPASRRLTLSPGGQRSLIERLEKVGVEGGAVYDGVIALTAASAGTPLLTLDRRALATYQRCGVEASLLSV